MDTRTPNDINEFMAERRDAMREMASDPETQTHVSRALTVWICIGAAVTIIVLVALPWPF